MLASFYTDSIGIYSVFGAFLVGVSIPSGKFSKTLQEKTVSLTVGLFLPLFFVYSGLNTELGLINSLQLWLIAAAVLVASVGGKAIACAIAARVSGQTWRESWIIGTLMNSRGLMELIIINIGLQAHLITPTLYTMLVVMAIVTTVMASPIFAVLYNRLKIADPESLTPTSTDIVPEMV
jgi:Kef-type K+ transport system membrane component KefB